MATGVSDRMNKQSGLARDLILNHRILTRGMCISIDALSDAEGAVEQDGFLLYFGCLLKALEAHHRVEDECMFPDWRTVVPAASYDVLEREHVAIARILDSLGSSLQSKQTLNAPKVVAQLEGISGIWRPHIQIEEDAFTAQAFNQALTAAEQEAAVARYAAYSLRLAGDPDVALPFLLLNLLEEDRAIFAWRIPSTQLERVFDEEGSWRSMRPYLLYESQHGEGGA